MHLLYYPRAYASFSKPCTLQRALKANSEMLQKHQSQDRNANTQDAFLHTGNCLSNFLTASSLNCCFSSTFAVVGVDDDNVSTARKPNIPFHWLCCKQPCSVQQQQTTQIKTRIMKALTKPIPLDKVDVIQHHFGKALRRGKQLLPGCVGSV